MEFPSYKKARRDIVEFGKRMYARGFANSNDGNLSARVSENAAWVTPSGVSKGFMTEDMLVLVDLDGNILEGTAKPSSETKLHLALYKSSPDILAVAHAHPPVATTFAAAGIPLDEALVQESVILLGVVPVAPYAAPGSEALAESVVPFCADYNALLLEHHGAVSWGESLERAFYRLESLEFTATVMMNSRLMNITRPLTEAQIDELIKLRPGWKVTRGGIPKGRKNK